MIESSLVSTSYTQCIGITKDRSQNKLRSNEHAFTVMYASSESLFKMDFKIKVDHGNSKIDLLSVVQSESIPLNFSSIMRKLTFMPASHITSVNGWENFWVLSTLKKDQSGRQADQLIVNDGVLFSEFFLSKSAASLFAEDSFSTLEHWEREMPVVEDFRYSQSRLLQPGRGSTVQD